MGGGAVLPFRHFFTTFRARSGALFINGAERATGERNRITRDRTGYRVGRAALDQLVGTDVVGIANAIQTAGQSAGTKTIIGSATALSPQNKTSGVSSLEFVIQSTGTFAQVWRAAQLFGALPLPASVEELDFEEIPGAGAAASGSWQLTARIMVLTSAQVSS